MYLIVGLGNPGTKYAGNRHNIGFMAVDSIANRCGFSAPKSKFSGLVREGLIDIGGQRVKTIILKPATFMNESGRSVAACAQFYKIPLDHIIVFHDELDLEPGKFRMKFGGGIAGHNGLRSIKAHMGANFHRARIGIGHPGHKDRVASYVLSDFAKSNSNWVCEFTDACARAAGLLAAGEFDKYQSRVSYLAPAPTAKKCKSKNRR
ncbi:MAG: aminoacyl-tRNA hydrolase [Robiginitomaculum sp.]